MIPKIKAVFALILLAAIYIFLVWLVVGTHDRNREKEHWPAFRSMQEEREFNRRLKKHGLAGHVSVIFGWPSAPCFYRDGKRCSFL